MWRPLMPKLANRFTVIAPDLPGIGGSAIPADGLDMARSAVRIHALVRSLGVDKAIVVGHDIGLMVAYAYAAQFPVGDREAGADGRVPPRRRGMGGHLQQPRDLALPVQRTDARSAGEGTRARSTSSTSGTTSPRTRRDPFPRPIVRPTPPRMRGRGACGRPGRTSCRFSRPRRTSRDSRRRS